MKKAARKQRISTPKALLSLMILLVVVAIGAICILHFWHRTPSYTTNAHTTSTTKSAQDNFKGDSQKTIPGNTPSPNAEATDQKGSTTAQTPPSSEWTSSSDGSSIVVYGPSKNSTFSSGSTVFGTAVSDKVSYRLSDSVSGLLTDGVADVVNGKFSIKLSFSTSANSGNIEIFNQTDPYSPERNNVIIPVSFK